MTLVIPWHTSRQELKFQISDLTLARLPLVVDSCQFGPDTKTEEIDLPPARTLLDGADGFLLRSAPVAGGRPLLELDQGYLIYTPIIYRRFFADLNQTFDEYTSKFSSKSRSTIRRKIRKFETESGGMVDFREFRSVESVQTFFSLAREVSAKTYQEKNLDAGLPDSPDFYERVLGDAKEGNFRGYVVCYEDKPISYLLLRAVDGTLLYEYLGYDPAFKSSSVGTILLWLALESIFAEGQFRILDFTEGEGEQKRRFATNHVDCGNIYCLRPTLRLRTLVRMHATFLSLVDKAAKLADKGDLRRRVRKRLRR